jgi:hypothetical protein
MFINELKSASVISVPLWWIFRTAAAGQDLCFSGHDHIPPNYCLLFMIHHSVVALSYNHPDWPSSEIPAMRAMISHRQTLARHGFTRIDADSTLSFPRRRGKHTKE